MPLNSYLRNLYGKASGKVKQAMKTRMEAQKNFNNRKDNSSYHGSYKEFLKK